MPQRTVVLSFLLAVAVGSQAADLSGRLPKAVVAKVDFAKEIKPILERSCAQCHSGEKPKGKFSVESRAKILKGSDEKEAIVPGKSGVSPLVHFVANLVPEMEMPPVAKRKTFPALTEREIGLLRGWIDQGAEWPAGVALTIAKASEETEVAGQKAARDPLFDSIRAGDRGAIEVVLRKPWAVELRDEEENTPLHQAAFYLSAADLKLFLTPGVDVNATNVAGLTPLMKAVWDLEKTKLLIKSGANVNAASKMGNTPLIIASFAHGASEVVKVLIAAGAKVDAANGLGGNAVVAAAEAGDLKTLRILLDHKADPNSKVRIVESGAEASALMMASIKGHLDCVKLLLERGADLNLRTAHGNALHFAAVSDRKDVAKFLLDRGIEVDVAGQRVLSFTKDMGLTPLIYASLSERNDASLVKLLIEKGANVNAKASSGETALTMAQKRGNTKIVAALLAAGAKAEEKGDVVEKLAALWKTEQVGGSDPKVVRAAVKAGVTEILKSGARLTEATANRCTTCHQQSIPAMVWSTAQAKGFEYPLETAKRQVAATEGGSKMFAGIATEMPLPVPNIASWFLMGMDAVGHAPDHFTDKFVYNLARYQYGDGRWVTKASRAPTDYSDVTSTAAAIRALKLYAPPTLRKRMDAQVAKAAVWLRGYQAQSTEERAMQLLGLHWAGAAEKGQMERLGAALLKEQRGDGGWAQLATLESDAYGTGLALYALKQAGIVAGSDAAYRRGTKFLLQTQRADGTWHVRTRVSPVQVAIDDIFPHGKDQWISTIATSWASMALMNAVESSEKFTAAR